MIEEIKDTASFKMESAIEHLNNELQKIRAGKATPDMLSSVYVDYYGTSTPLSQVASVNTLDARTLTVKPWEKELLSEIEKAIVNGNLGLNPQNNGEAILINIPVLTEERRLKLCKQVKTEGEEAKISIRNARKEANEQAKKLKKDEEINEDELRQIENHIQNIVDTFVAKVDTLVEVKSGDIMKV